MNRTVGTLLLLLLIQCAMVAIVYWPATDALPSGGSVAPGSPFDSLSVDEIRITDSAGSKALLQKIGDRWLLPALTGLPADAEMVDKLREGLAEADYSWPIAQSVAARQRFQVADYRFQRRLDFWSAGQTRATIFLGTSPGFRKVHARIENSAPIYSIAFNVFEAPAKDGAWIDRRLLQVRTPVRISSDAYSVRLEDSEWRAGNGNIPDDREMLALLAGLRSLQVDGVADEATRQALVGIDAELVLDIESLSGEIELQLFQLAAKYYIRSSEYPYFFTLSAFDFDRLNGIDFVLISAPDAPLALEADPAAAQ